jgi:hypothetical protein
MWATDYRARIDAWTVVPVGAAFGYAAALLIGVPAYVLITTHSKLRLVHTLAVSAAAGMATMASVSEGRSLASAALGLPLGLSAGLAFWLILRRAAHKSVATDGAGAVRS